MLSLLVHMTMSVATTVDNCKYYYVQCMVFVFWFFLLCSLPSYPHESLKKAFCWFRYTRAMLARHIQIIYQPSRTMEHGGGHKPHTTVRHIENFERICHLCRANELCRKSGSYSYLLMKR